jgi:hypothetical protein
MPSLLVVEEDRSVPGASFLDQRQTIETVHQAGVARADRMLGKPVDPTERVHVLEGKWAGKAIAEIGGRRWKR